METNVNFDDSGLAQTEIGGPREVDAHFFLPGPFTLVADCAFLSSEEGFLSRLSMHQSQ